MKVDGSELALSLEAGYTLPAHWYSDPSLLAREQEMIFRRAWVYAGHVGQVARAGDFFTLEAGGVPLVVVRDQEETLRAFVNVCRHRGTIVASGSGNRATLQCPYHAWTYDFDGRLRAAPRSDTEANFEADELGLLPVRLETWGPFIFICLDEEVQPLASQLGDLPSQLEKGGIEIEELRFHAHDEWELRANWKIAIENYLECYHCPVAHPQFSSVIDVRPEEYTLGAKGLVWSQVGPLRESVRTGRQAGSEWARGVVADSQFHLFWPNCTFNTYPGPPNLTVTAYRPIDSERTLMVSDAFYGEGVHRADIDSMIEFSAQVTREDQELVESVHRGLRSGLVKQGRLLLNSEHLIQRFQRFVYEALEGESAG
jgi:carnitine monooxygenase subunit